MRRRLLRYGAVAAGAVLLLLAVPATADAHPLGNFTVNRYSGLVVATDGVTVDHVLDLAEIPTAQRVPAADSDGDGRLSRPELAAYAQGACRDAAARMRLTVGGRPAALRVTSDSARTRAGQAGLPTLRVECALHADAQVTATTGVAFADGAADDEIGWREVTARADGTTLIGSDVPETSSSRRLTAYPKDLLSSPADVRSASLRVRPGGERLAAVADESSTTPGSDATAGGYTATPRAAGGLAGALDGLVARYDGGLGLAVISLVVALVLGAGHAVAPGHGKTVMAFYLSGRRNDSVRAAATVGATVTATHTAGVLALGLLVSAGTSFVPARVYPWLTAASGLLVVAVGFTLLRESRHSHSHDHPHPQLPAMASLPSTRVGDWRPDGALTDTLSRHSPAPVLVQAAPLAIGHHQPPVLVEAAPPTNGHHHDGHHHDGHHHDGHHHTDGHHHDRHATDEARASRRGLVAMGLAGGLLPSPSALVVFLGALALGHPWFGVLLVAAFGMGMATTLAAVGLVVVRLRGRLEQRLARRGTSRLAPVVRLLPVLTATGVVALGATIALRGLTGIG